MASRTIKTPGATTETTGETTQTTAEIADAALEHIHADGTAVTKTSEPTNEELKRQLEEVQAQLAELKKSTQGEANASSGSTGEVQPKKRVPVLAEDGWTTKEVD